MSPPLLRQARLSQSLAATRRAAYRTRYYSISAAHAQLRRDPEPGEDDAPIAGPSSPQQEASAADGVQSKPTLAGKHPSSEFVEPFSRVQTYLASINASGLQPTLEDLERCRPSRRPSPHSPQYVETYNELLNTLSRSFTKEQLRQFLVQSLGTSRHCRTHRKKVEYAESIIEQMWQWPTLKDVEKAKRDRTEVVTKLLPVTASELFLILGRDGSDLLRLSKDYDVHISLRRNPMALRVEGTQGALRDLTEHILTLKQGFVEELYDLPSPVAIPQDMVQRISRLASAYLENVSSAPGKLRIVAKDEQGLSSAKRLASRAIHEIQETAYTPLLTYLPAGAASLATEQLVMFPHKYALYPYLSPRPLPFTMNTSGTFRLRRVGEWLSSNFRDDLRSIGGLAQGNGHVLSAFEEEAKLKTTLLHTMEGVELTDQSRTIIKASMGHILLTRPSGEQRATLVPPLTGEHPFGKIRKWIAQNPVKMTFVSDLPLPLLNTSPAQQSVKHRLIYHALGSGTNGADGESQDIPTSPSLPIRRRKVLSLEATLVEPSTVESRHVARDHTLLPQLDLEDELSFKEEGGTQPLPTYRSRPAEPSVPILDASGVHCWTGVEADLNLMIPDRPMDLQFTVRSSTVLAESRQPAELQQYVVQLRAYLQGTDGMVEAPEHPSPPLLIEYGGERYILHMNSTVRQSVEVVSDAGLPSFRDPDPTTSDVTRALCESTLDLESNQKSMDCEVICEDAASEETWNHFLRDCDRLSTMREPAKKPVATSLLHLDDIQ
ncbi:hypothetical protein BC628DRAFT_1416167 [Trametes gibbosa]|nr:hypothetical protein BC628DRAFT_1416167 [Trametes gibbosa]